MDSHAARVLCRQGVRLCKLLKRVKIIYKNYSVNVLSCGTNQGSAKKKKQRLFLINMNFINMLNILVVCKLIIPTVYPGSLLILFQTVVFGGLPVD